jgi:type 1 glutamine amidotransferase
MKLFLCFLLVAAVALPFSESSAADAMPAKKKILVFTKSSGFEHEAIKLKMKNGERGYAYPVLEEIGRKNNIEMVFSKDGSLFTPKYLAQFDAFLFYTTGDLTLAKNNEKDGDGNPPMTPAGKAALLKAIANGKGFIGVHSATDTFHSVGNKEHGPERFQSDGAKADDYVKMIGAEFIQHGSQQKSPQRVADAKFPGMSAVPADFGPLEEWYSLKDFSPDLHVLLVQDTSGMKGVEYARPPYPSTWARMNGKGRVFYTSMGHREDIWTNPVFQAVLTGGIQWTLRRVDADVTPNLQQVAPQAELLPKYVPKPTATPATATPATPAADAAPAKP